MCRKSMHNKNPKLLLFQSYKHVLETEMEHRFLLFEFNDAEYRLKWSSFNRQPSSQSQPASIHETETYWRVCLVRLSVLVVTINELNENTTLFQLPACSYLLLLLLPLLLWCCYSPFLFRCDEVQFFFVVMHVIKAHRVHYYAKWG